MGIISGIKPKSIPVSKLLGYDKKIVQQTGNLPASLGGGSDNVYFSLTAGEAIAAGKPVGIVNGLIMLANNSTIPCKGFAVATTAINEICRAQKSGVFSLATGFSIGDTIYLSTSGLVTKNQPVTAGLLIQVLGGVLSSNQIFIDLREPLRI